MLKPILSLVALFVVSFSFAHPEYLRPSTYTRSATSVVTPVSPPAPVQSVTSPDLALSPVSIPAQPTAYVPVPNGVKPTGMALGVITKPVVQRALDNQPVSSGKVLGASTDSVQYALADIQQKLSALSLQISGMGTQGFFNGGLPSSGGYLNNLALSQVVNNLPSNVTVGGSSVATTQSLGNYLPLTGGTLTGALTSSSTATTTLTAGIAIDSGCFRMPNGTCLTSGGGSSQWTTSGSDISYSTGNVGIGTTSPSSVFSLQASGTPSGGLYNTYWGAPQHSFNTQSVSLSGLSGSWVNSYAAQNIRSSFNLANYDGFSAGTISHTTITSAGAVGGAMVAAVSGDALYTAQENDTALYIAGGYYNAANMSAGRTIGSTNGVFALAGNNAAGATSTDVRVFQGHLANSGSGAGITNGSVFYGRILNFTAGAAITNASGLRVDNLFNNGTITNTYGVYVGDLTTGTQTNTPYSFYASDAGTNNYFAGNVGVGSTTPWAKLSIQATSNTSTPQFFVGSSTEPSLFVNARGRLGVGTTTPTSRASIVDTLRVTSGTAYGADVTVSLEPTSDQTMSLATRMRGLQSSITIPSSNTRNIGWATGAFNFSSNYGTGNVYKLMGSVADAYNDASTTVSEIAGSLAIGESNAGTVTQLSGSKVWNGVYGGYANHMYGYYLEDLYNGGGLVDNRYGLYISNYTGSATNDYGIYQASSVPRNYFAGATGIGTSSPWAKFSVQSASNTSTPQFVVGSSTASSLFVGADGNVGIGGTAPFAKLSIDTRDATSTPLAIRTTGYAGNYTATSSGIFIYDKAGTETMRIYASDPNASNYNSANTYIGMQAGAGNTTDNVSGGYYNTGIGYKALTAVTTGGSNSAIGAYSLFSNQTGLNNIAIGSSALYATISSGNTAIGGNVLGNNTTGPNNTALGRLALYNNRSATNTTAVGYSAGAGTGAYSNQGGVYLGYQSGYSAANSSDYNTFLGYQSGYNVTTGSNNIILGSATSATAVANLTTGSQNILIGNNISFPSATASGQLNIGNILFGTGITGTGSTLSSGNLGIGTTSPYTKFGVTGSSTIDGSLLLTGQAFIGNSSSPFSSSNPSALEVSKNFTSGTNAFYKGINTYLTASPSSDVAFGYIGINQQIDVPTANSQSIGNLVGGSFSVDKYGGGTISNLIGVENFLYNEESANVTNLSANKAYFGNYGSGVVTNAKGYNLQFFGNNGSGYTVNLYGLSIPTANNTGGGSIGNVYGVYVGDQSGIGTSTSYNIFSAGSAANNHFAGLVGIGTTTPWGKLSVLATDNSSSPQFVVGSSTATSFVVDSSGNIGIGTSRPSGLLQIYGTTTLATGQYKSQSLSYLSITPSATSSTGYFASKNASIVPSTNNRGWGVLYGTYSQAYNYSASGGSTLVGSESDVSSSNGVVTNGIYGASGDAFLSGGSTPWLASFTGATSVFGGAVTNVAGLYISDFGNYGGSITNRYGVYLPSPAGSATNDYAFYSAGSGQGSYLAGALGLGTTSPTAKFSISANNGDTRTRLIDVASSTAAATSSLFVLTNTGYVGLGSSTPWRVLSVVGTVGLDGLTASVGAGSLCLSVGNEVVYNAASDNCLASLRATKHDISPLELSGTSTVAALQPVSFIYNDDASSTVRYGFIAEDAAAVDAHLGTYGQSGALSGVDDRGLIAVVVAALKELMVTVGDLAERVVTKEIVAQNIEADRATFNTLCLEDVCVTKEQLQNLLNQSGQQAAAAAPEPPAPEPAPPEETPTADSPPPTEEPSTPVEPPADPAPQEEPPAPAEPAPAPVE